MPDGYARELRRMAVAAGPKIVRSDVFTRDEWTCYLCGKKVARNAKDPLARGSLDHVIPIVLGGHHSPDNVRTTHLRCNLNKSDNYFSPTQVAALAAYMQDTQEEDTSGPDWAPADGE